VSQLLILIFGVVLILLPLTIQGLLQLLDLVFLQQSRQYLEQTILSAYSCMEPEYLAVGQPKLDDRKTDTVLRRQFAVCLPDSLSSRLRMTDLDIAEKWIEPIQDHWMGDDQPQFLPIVTISAVYVDHQGNQIPLNHRIELLID
jgi:hypothetical protein